MLEFDVATQLFPNPLSIITQLLSTLIIFLVAKKYLFKEARKFLDARSHKMQEELDAAQMKNLQAQQYLDEAKNDLMKFQNETKILKQQAKQDADNLREQLIKEAQNEADDIISKARFKTAKEKAEVLKDIEKYIVDVAINASGKILEKDYSEIDQKSALKIVKELSDEWY